MLKQENIHIGKLLRFDLYRPHQSFIGVVTHLDPDGFWIHFHDGDKLYAWYKYDLGDYTPLEIK